MRGRETCDPSISLLFLFFEEINVLAYIGMSLRNQIFAEKPKGEMEFSPDDDEIRALRGIESPLERDKRKKIFVFLPPSFSVLPFNTSRFQSTQTHLQLPIPNHHASSHSSHLGRYSSSFHCFSSSSCRQQTARQLPRRRWKVFL